MELFKGLTQEEFKELRSIIIDIGLIIEFGIKDWKLYIEKCTEDKSYSFVSALADIKYSNNINLIIQGVLNE